MEFSNVIGRNLLHVFSILGVVLSHPFKNRYFLEKSVISRSRFRGDDPLSFLHLKKSKFFRAVKSIVTTFAALPFCKLNVLISIAAAANT